MRLLRGLLIVLVAAILVGWIAWVRRLAHEPLDGARAAGDVLERRAPETLDGLEELPFTFTSNTDCEPCHREIYAEWFEDQHAQAWFNTPLLAQDPKRVECNNCHAPRPILEVGLDKLPLIRSERFEEGVGCIECHRNQSHVEGPVPSSRAACNPRRNPVFDGSTVCAPCHAPHGSFDEWRTSAWAMKGYGCPTCHMPIVDSPAVTGGPARRRRSHRMRSQRDPQMLREALTLELTLLGGGRVEVSVTNSGAGHNVPGEIFNREVFLSTVVLDGKGEPLARHRESFRTVRRESRASLPSTQLRPAERRAFTYDLGTGHGTITASLGYKLLSFIPDDRAIPILEKELEF
jgi:hypothetical protein